MPDRARKLRVAAGSVLLIFAAAAVLVPPLSHSGPAGRRYRAAGNRTFRTPQASGREERKEGALDLNTADAGELAGLPGIGEVYAGRIIAERELNGPFFYPEDLEAVSGIGPKTVEKIRDRVRTANE